MQQDPSGSNCHASLFTTSSKTSWRGSQFWRLLEFVGAIRVWKVQFCAYCRQLRHGARNHGDSPKSLRSSSKHFGADCLDPHCVSKFTPRNQELEFIAWLPQEALSSITAIHCGLSRSSGSSARVGSVLKLDVATRRFVKIAMGLFYFGSSQWGRCCYSIWTQMKALLQTKGPPHGAGWVTSGNRLHSSSHLHLLDAGRSRTVVTPRTSHGKRSLFSTSPSLGASARRSLFVRDTFPVDSRFLDLRLRASWGLLLWKWFWDDSRRACVCVLG